MIYIRFICLGDNISETKHINIKYIIKYIHILYKYNFLFRKILIILIYIYKKNHILNNKNKLNLIKI